MRHSNARTRILALAAQSGPKNKGWRCLCAGSGALPDTIGILTIWTASSVLSSLGRCASMAKATQLAMIVASTVHSKTEFSIMALVLRRNKLCSSNINKLDVPLSCESPIVSNLVVKRNWRCLELSLCLSCEASSSWSSFAFVVEANVDCGPIADASDLNASAASVSLCVRCWFETSALDKACNLWRSAHCCVCASACFVWGARGLRAIQYCQRGASDVEWRRWL